MRTTLCCGSEWLCASLIVMCIFLHLSSAFGEQPILDKRIFCNFDGCHNKRSDIRGPGSAAKFFKSLLSDKSRAAAVDAMETPAENRVTNDKYFGGNWEDALSFGPSDELNMTPAQVQDFLRQLSGHIKRRRSVF